MVSFKHYIFFFLILFLAACGKKEFSLEFNLPEDVTENYNVTYYSSDTKFGATVQAVASVREGKCTLDGFTKNPTLVYITPRRSMFPLVALIEKGNKIKISGESKNPLEWNVEGNKINEALSEWRLANLKVLESSDVDSVNLAVKNFIEEEPNNPVSTIILLCYYQRNKDEREFTNLMSSLKGEAMNSHWLDLIARGDRLSNENHFPANLQSIVMKSKNKNKDTLYINHRDPVILFFWSNSNLQRKAIMDSIKVLTKEIPDSSFLLADICLDSDSVGWKNSLKRDSLDDNKRFWAPSGLADPKIQKFKVASIPYFIVFDKDGSQYYRGKEISEALNSYRELYNLKDSL